MAGQHAVTQALNASTPGRLLHGSAGGEADSSRLRTTAIMQGDLRDHALPDLLQFLQAMRKKGQLLIEGGESRQSASVYFSAGRVVHACCPPEQGEQAVYRLLHWRHGRFIFLAGAAPEQETIHTDLRNLLLEGMRLIDEIPDPLSQLPAADTVLHCERDALRLDQVRVNLRQWKLYASVNGRRTIHDLIALSGREPLEVSRDLYHLLMVGLVSERHDDAFLAAIIAQAAVHDDPFGTPPPLPILSGHILRLADGRRSLQEIRAALHCGEQDLIEEFRYLVRSRRVRLLAGHQEFERFVR
jgi:hypothetical protein